MIKNILITGATSFTGKHLVKKLVDEKKYNITLLVRKNSNLDLIGDCIKFVTIHIYDNTYHSIDEVFKKNNFDCVIHLAANIALNIEPSKISDMVDANLKLGIFILEAMNTYKCKYIINTSSYWQNFMKGQIPNSLYAATKAAFENIIDYYVWNKKISAISLKLYDVYGHNDHRDKLISNLLRDKNCESKYELTDGKQKIYLVYIDDVLDAYTHSMSLIQGSEFINNHHIYGVKGDNKITLREFVNILESIRKKKFNISWGVINYDKTQIMEPYEEKNLIHWRPKVSLDKGVKSI